MRITSFASRPARQQGSTLTGLIIGLIIGLAIAVAVALAITKGATPFTDKQAKPARTDAPGQVSDPNKPMYGNKDSAREANKQLADKPKPAAPATPASPATPATPAKPAADADPLGKVIAGLKEPGEAKPSKATVAAEHELARVAAARAEAVDDTKVVYFLQAGAFREMGDAESTRAKLALLGFEASISDRTSDAGVLHRVRIGPYGQVESMNKARAKLIDAGVDVAIVRNQK